MFHPLYGLKSMYKRNASKLTKLRHLDVRSVAAHRHHYLAKAFRPVASCHHNSAEACVASLLGARKAPDELRRFSG